MNLEDYGFNPASMEAFETTGRLPARVTSVHRERFGLLCEHGETYGRLKPGAYYAGTEAFPTVGDFVLIAYNPMGDSQITETLPRKTAFSRRDPTPGRGEQMVAANFDYVFIMQSLNHNFNPKRIERYLTLAWHSGASPVILLTKADLMEDFTQQVRQAEAVAPGIEIHVISAKTRYGLSRLEKYLQPGKTIVFLGSSGIGKSSLVNALAGEELMAVSRIREEDSRGRHTTTHRQLLRLKSGVMIIDTPGMRELGMWDISEGLSEAFTDVEQYFGKCKFSDCKHNSEPGCAVKAALESGELSRERWESYCSLKGEAKYSDDKNAFLRQRQQQGKSIAKWNRQRKAANKKYHGEMF